MSSNVFIMSTLINAGGWQQQRNLHKMLYVNNAASYLVELSFSTCCPCLYFFFQLSINTALQHLLPISQCFQHSNFLTHPQTTDPQNSPICHEIHLIHCCHQLLKPSFPHNKSSSEHKMFLYFYFLRIWAADSKRICHQSDQKSTFGVLPAETLWQ